MALKTQKTANKPVEPKKEIPSTSWPDWLKGSLGFFLETVKIFLIALAIILPVRYFLVQPFYVKGASMEPTFHDYEYLLIDEISYRVGQPQRGDIVVFRYPEDKSQFFIKRIIGLPGETLDVTSDGRVQVTPVGPGSPVVLNETYLSPSLQTDCIKQYDCKFPLTLGVNEFGVMGDNRPASLDSRYFGVVPRSDIVGKAWVRVWPFSNFTVFKHFSYHQTGL